jgi:hypothetical protein
VAGEHGTHFGLLSERFEMLVLRVSFSLEMDELKHPAKNQTGDAWLETLWLKIRNDSCDFQRRRFFRNSTCGRFQNGAGEFEILGFQ